MSEKIRIIFKSIGWITYICFTVLAVQFTKSVLQQYQAKETFMAQSFKPIKRLPTIMFCLEKRDDWQTWKLHHDVWLKYEIEASSMENENETLISEQVSDTCFKHNFTMGSSLRKSSGRRTFSMFFPYGNHTWPLSVRLIFTSEENSYGIFDFEWFDGDPYDKKLELGHAYWFSIKPLEYYSLGNDAECGNETFLDQWKKYIEANNISFSPKCEKKCAPFTFLATDELTLCPSHEKNNIVCNKYENFMPNYNEFKKKFKRSCHILEYGGKNTNDFRINPESVSVMYFFAQPKMTIETQERLVFDEVGMIGSVGGTLGMCIGFSFTGITSTILEYLESRIQNIF